MLMVGIFSEELIFWLLTTYYGGRIFHGTGISWHCGSLSRLSDLAGPPPLWRSNATPALFRMLGWCNPAAEMS
jgi:hypothetical protein